MSSITIIKKPIIKELDEFVSLFNETLSSGDGLLRDALKHISQRGGKRMRPILMLLLAKNFGEISDVTQRSAIGLELLHTASLVHDDVVDESNERRGQPSLNASYNNQVAVLVGDFILSTALLQVAKTTDYRIVSALAELGRTLSNGEILQLSSITNEKICEETYFNVIKQKTAALFETCAEIAVLSTCGTQEQVNEAKKFGQTLGIIFQIKDDIFDYYPSKEIGKPTGNDMIEGKLTLPVIFALNKMQDKEMYSIAQKVKNQEASNDEINKLVQFTKDNGGIEYAQEQMQLLHKNAKVFIEKHVKSQDISNALNAYLDFIVERNK